MVRTWGPVQDGAALEAVLPTLQHWVALLGGGELPGPGSASGRQPFQPPRAAVWRALHGLLPLLQGEAAAALLPQVPQLPEAVLGGLEAAAGPHTPQDAELCCWYAAGCWSHLLAAAGEDTFFHCAASPAAIVRQLAAAAGSSAGSERLHKAAAWAVAATLRHAAGSAAVDFEEAAATLRQGLLFLLHDIPDAAAAAAAPNQQHQKQPSPGRPRFSQLSVAVAEGAAFSTLLHLLQRGGNPAEAALRCAHFWLPPLAASLWHRGEGGSGSEPVATQHQQQRSPTLFAAADKAALQLAAAVLAGEVAALTAAAGAAAPDVPADAAVAAVAAVAAREGSSWHCLPALWSCLASASASHELSGLMLGAAADLCKLSSSSAASLGAAPAAFPVSAAAGFSAPGLASSLASDIAAAQRCLPLWQALRRRFLDEGQGLAGWLAAVPHVVPPLPHCLHSARLTLPPLALLLAAQTAARRRLLPSALAGAQPT